jgi:hypothetical protein
MGKDSARVQNRHKEQYRQRQQLCAVHVALVAAILQKRFTLLYLIRAPFLKPAHALVQSGFAIAANRDIMFRNLFVYLTVPT